MCVNRMRSTYCFYTCSRAPDSPDVTQHRKHPNFIVQTEIVHFKILKRSKHQFLINSLLLEVFCHSIYFQNPLICIISKFNIGTSTDAIKIQTITFQSFYKNKFFFHRSYSQLDIHICQFSNTSCFSHNE